MSENKNSLCKRVSQQKMAFVVCHLPVVCTNYLITAFSQVSQETLGDKLLNVIT